MHDVTNKQKNVSVEIMDGTHNVQYWRSNFMAYSGMLYKRLANLDAYSIKNLQQSTKCRKNMRR